MQRCGQGEAVWRLRQSRGLQAQRAHEVRLDLVDCRDGWRRRISGGQIEPIASQDGSST